MKGSQTRLKNRMKLLVKRFDEVMQKSKPYKQWGIKELIKKINEPLAANKRINVDQFHFILPNQNKWKAFRNKGKPTTYIFIKKKKRR